MPREAGLKRLDVVAGILRDAAGRVLIAERLEPGPYHGMWEFPGGKIGSGEDPAAALGRELREELGIEILSAAEFTRLEHRYSDRHVSIRFFLVEAWHHVPAGQEGQRLRWLTAAELTSANLLPADAPVIEALLQQL